MEKKPGKRIYGISAASCALLLSSCLSNFEQLFPKDGALVTLPDGNIRFSCPLYKYRDDDGPKEGKRAFTFTRPNMNFLHYKFFCGTQSTASVGWQKQEIDLATSTPNCAADSMRWDIKNFEQRELQDGSTAIFPENQKLKRVVITVLCKK